MLRETEETMIPPHRQTWVDFDDLERADFDWILGVISDETELPVVPLEEADFERLRQDFNDYGFATWDIKKSTTPLRVIKRIGLKGKPLARVEVGGYFRATGNLTSVERKKMVQERMDSHFIERKAAVPPRVIVPRAY